MSYVYNRNYFTKVTIYRGPEELYLTRYVIFRTKLLSLYIHCFHVSDYKVPHDHPANFMSIPIKGPGYFEHLMDGTILNRKNFRPKFRTAEEFHHVQLKPGGEGKTWTFFIFGRRRRDWGFLTRDGWISHEKYLEVIQ